MSRRNAVSLAAGQTAAGAIHTQHASSGYIVIADATDSPAKAAQVFPSEDTTMADAAVIPPSPRCQPNQVRPSVPAQVKHTLTSPQTSTLGPIKLSDVLHERTVEDETKISPKSKEKGKEKETVKDNGKTAKSGAMFPNLARTCPANLQEREDLSRYVVDAPPLPQQDDRAEESSKDKGKGKASETPSSSATLFAGSLATPGPKPKACAFQTKKVAASVERRASNYAVHHPSGWFDDLPPINEDLFLDSPHKEYKMVLIHTARCNVCLQYNKGTLFMCAACTVSICEGCADIKSGVSVANGDDGDDVVMAGAGKEGRAEEDAGVTTTEDAGEAADARKLDWCGPYHEIFRDAYLEWTVAEGARKGFTSSGGVAFKTSTGKQGGRKRKAT